MLSIAENEANAGLPEIEKAEPRTNSIWGPEYFLMDSKAFMGGKEGSGYDKIITVFQGIWENSRGSIIRRNEYGLL